MFVNEEFILYAVSTTTKTSHMVVCSFRKGRVCCINGNIDSRG